MNGMQKGEKEKRKEAGRTDDYAKRSTHYLLCYVTKAMRKGRRIRERETIRVLV